MTGQRGFTLFELMIYILVVAILFTIAMNRFRELPAEAERANFLAVSMQLKSAVNLEMMAAIGSGSWPDLTRLEGSNPMDLLLETPGNYLGSFTPAETQDLPDLPERSWYFDSARGELVYLVGYGENLVLLDENISPDRIRFRIVNEHGASKEESNWRGLVLRTVTPYRWFNGDRDLERLAAL